MPGDPLEVRIGRQGRWELLNRVGLTVGRLAQNFKPPAGTRCRSATVFAATGRNRDESKPEYQDAMKCDTWEVIMPEFVFEPNR